MKRFTTLLVTMVIVLILAGCGPFGKKDNGDANQGNNEGEENNEQLNNGEDEAGDNEGQDSETPKKPKEPKSPEDDKKEKSDPNKGNGDSNPNPVNPPDSDKNDEEKIIKIPVKEKPSTDKVNKVNNKKTEKVSEKKKSGSKNSNTKKDRPKKPSNNKDQSKNDKIVVKNETSERSIAFKTIEKQDETMYVTDNPVVKQKGSNGVETITYKVTYKNNKVVSREEVKRSVTTSPVDEIVLIGTKDLIEVSQKKVTENIPFKTVEEEDSSIEKGKRITKQKGKNGTKEITYEVTHKNGKEISRVEVDQEVILAPTNEIITVGTKLVEYKEVLDEAVIPFETIEEDDPNLELGKTKVKQQGKNGKTVMTYKEKYVNGEFVSRELINKETVDPVNKIILVGSMVVDIVQEKTEYDIAYETIEKEDDSIDFGETVIEQNGVSGKGVITYDVTYHNGKEVNRQEVSNEVILEPINKIILVGTKDVIKVVTEAEEVEVDFDIIEEEDSSLEVGKTKVKQVGKKGMKEIVYEITYVNGEVSNKKVLSSEVIIEPINEIILVGTKEIVEDIITTEEVVETNEIDFKTVEESDPTLEVGKTKVKQEGKKGILEVHYEVTYTNGIETGRKLIKEVVIKEPVTKVVLKGTKVVSEIEFNYEFEKEVVRLVNIEREAVGLEALTMNSVTTQIARDYSVFMIENDIYGHSNYAARLTENGIKYHYAGENIAFGQTTPEEVVSAWMDSYGHRENILHPDYTEIGVGYARGDTQGLTNKALWTQIFHGEYPNPLLNE